MNSKKSVLMVMILVGVLMFSVFVSAGWLSDLLGIGDEKEGLEGELQETTAAQVELANAPPEIIEVGQPYTAGGDIPPVLNELDLSGAEPDETTDVYVYFIAYDSNGYLDIDTASAMIEFNHSENDPSGGSYPEQNWRNGFFCDTGTILTTQAGDFNSRFSAGTELLNFSCIVQMHFFDTPYDNWQVNATISDVGGSEVMNNSLYFNVAPSVYFSLGPVLLSWTGVPSKAAFPSGGLNPNDGNPITLNNTGNVNYDGVSDNYIQMLGLDLVGDGANSEQLIYAEYFSVNAQSSEPTNCDDLTSGTEKLVLKNQTIDTTSQVPQSLAFTSPATLPRGNSSISGTEEGKENLYFCMGDINFGLSAQQTYTTAVAGGSPQAWQIEVYTS